MSMPCQAANGRAPAPHWTYMYSEQQHLSVYRQVGLHRGVFGGKWATQGSGNIRGL